jgi:homoserine dehydrogenase
MQNKKTKIAVAGIGNVGSEVLNILKNQDDYWQLHNGFEIVAVSSRTAKANIPSGVIFYKDPLLMIAETDAEIIVELIGGVEIAKAVAVATIKAKKHLVTANKALLAICGNELADLAMENLVNIGFEASVGGSIPIINTLKHSLVANKISKIIAIVNGTCNYILSQMFASGASFTDALNRAKDLGFAEADPTADIDGIDSAHKLTLLATLAMKQKPCFVPENITGIAKITDIQMNLAKDLGYCIKLIATTEDLDGQVVYNVSPALVSSDSLMAKVVDATNVIAVSTNNCGWQYFVGAGAGGLATATAVVADLVQIASQKSYNIVKPVFGLKTANLKNSSFVKIDNSPLDYFFMANVASNYRKDQEIGLFDAIFSKELPIEKMIISEDEKNNSLVFGVIIKNSSASQIKEQILVNNPILIDYQLLPIFHC